MIDSPCLAPGNRAARTAEATAAYQDLAASPIQLSDWDSGQMARDDGSPDRPDTQLPSLFKNARPCAPKPQQAQQFLLDRSVERRGQRTIINGNRGTSRHRAHIGTRPDELVGVIENNPGFGGPPIKG